MPTLGELYGSIDLERARRASAWEKHLLSIGFSTTKAYVVSRRRADKGTWPPQ